MILFLFGISLCLNIVLILFGISLYKKFIPVFKSSTSIDLDNIDVKFWGGDD